MAQPGLAIAVIGLCLPMAAAAAPGKLLQTACTESDAVVLGTVEPVLLTVAPAVFTLTIDGVIKGPLPEKSNVTVSWPGSLMAARVNPIHYRALWFLRSKGSVGWEIMPIGGRKAPMFASGLALTPTSGIALRAASSLRCYEAVWTALKESAALIDQAPVYFTAMETLFSEVPAPGVASANFADTMAAFARSPSIELKTLALASGIRGHDVQSLTRLAADITAVSKSRPRATGPASIALMEWRDSEPAGLAALGAIAAQPDAPGLSWAASQALMMIHTKDAVPHLVKLLAVPNRQRQEESIRGLSLFVRGVPILNGPEVRAMAYLAEGQNPAYMDDKIAPYVTITGYPPDRGDEYVKAWLNWWSRMEPKWAQ